MPARLDELSVFPFSKIQCEGRGILADPSSDRALDRLAEALVLLHGLNIHADNFAGLGVAGNKLRDSRIAFHDGKKERNFTGDLQIKLARDVCQRRDAVGAGFVLGDKDRDFEKDIEKPVKRFSLLGSRENVVVELGYDKRLSGRDVLLQVIHNPLLDGKICLRYYHTRRTTKAEGPARISGEVFSVPLNLMREVSSL